MSADRLAIISTRLPPAICGIGSYSWMLRKHWPNERSTAEFLVLDGDRRVTDLGDKVTLFHGRARDLTRELDRLGSTKLFLHYAGRAYQRFGLPFWMPRVLARWKRKFPQARLAIFVHEMPARFPITSRHFWLAQGSARIVRRLAAIADLLMTNTAEHAAQLRRISGRDDIHLFPVGSNIESAESQPQPRARTEFIVFGLPFGQWQTLQLFAPQIRRWQEGQLTKLHLVGPQDGDFSRRADQLVAPDLVVRHGMLPSAQVANLLRRVGFALSNVSEKTWNKSSAFMACAANDCPIVIASARPEDSPLSYAVEVKEVATISDPELHRRTAALAEWYRSEADWPVIASRMAALLNREETRA